MKRTTRLILGVAAVAIPLAAYAAIDTAEKRFGMSGRYVPHSGLTDDFGRFAMSGMYVPQEEGGGGGSPGTQRLLLLGAGAQ